MTLLPQTPITARVLSGLCLVGVFVLDLVTPLGVPIWLLYGMPFYFLRDHPVQVHIFALAAASTCLILVGYLLSSGTQTEPIMERVGATIIVWFIAMVLVRRKQPA